MMDSTLALHQMAIVQAPLDRRTFLVGPAGTGKTTAGVARMLHLLASGVPAESLLVLVPQRTLGHPYAQALRGPGSRPGGAVNVATVGGLARRMIDIFWPLVSEQAGFADPDARPNFLTLETAQYHMAHVVGPLIDKEGYFDAITIDRNRLYSQILDNLNKSAVVGFDPAEIAARLKGAWMGEQAQSRVYDEAQACALRFRRYCLKHNLLDFSLQVSVFAEYLWHEPLCRNYLTETYRHLIVDNIEEDTPVAHDVIYSCVGTAQSALVVFDQDAGYRSFLGADPVSASALRDLCDETVDFSESFVVSPLMATLGASFDCVLRPAESTSTCDAAVIPVGDNAGSDAAVSDGNHRLGGVPRFRAGEIGRVLRFENHRFHPEMLDWVAEQIRGLVHDEGIPPGEIVVLAPFLSDALRFSLMHRLAQVGVPARSHRPSRALRDEPAAQTLLTLAALAHPRWGIMPTPHDVVYAFMSSIHDLDLIRAQLLTQVAYRRNDGAPELVSFDDIRSDMQQRITFALGERYEQLRGWLVRYADDAPAPFDHFLSRLFGEVLSQGGYGFHLDLDAGRVAAMLVESVRKFRKCTSEFPDGVTLGEEYVRMVRAGVIAAQYLTPWQDPSDDAVLLAPAHTFLLSNRPVDVQVWLNVGGQGWWERLYQPLTHPFVLSRRWPSGKVWTDADEFALRQRSLHRLVTGLIRRCRKAVYLGLSEFSEQGYEQEGPLLRAVQRVLRDAG